MLASLKISLFQYDFNKIGNYCTQYQYIHNISLIRMELNYFGIIPDKSPKIGIVKLRQGSGKDRQGMALKAKGLKA